MRVRFVVVTRGPGSGAMAGRARRAVVLAARECGRDVAEAARRLAPRHTGALAASVGSVASARGDTVSVTVGASKPQGRWTELGNTPNAHVPGVGPVIAPVRAAALRVPRPAAPPVFVAWVRPIRPGTVERPRDSWPALEERGDRGQLMPWLRVAFRRSRDAIVARLSAAVSAALSP